MRRAWTRARSKRRWAAFAGRSRRCRRLMRPSSGTGARSTTTPARADALVHLPAVTVDDALARRLRAGQRVAWSAMTETLPGRVRVLDAAGELIAVAEPRADGLVHTLRVFGAASQKLAADVTATV